jgi:DNA-binding CsgD family transcriptional regulator
MEIPPIRYVKTSDGVAIAYTVAGSGPPLVYCWGTTSSHTGLVWRSPGLRAPAERLSAYFTVYQFDWRNTGSSTRGVPFGRDEWIRDLEAVFSLFDGPADIVAGGPPVAPYVAGHQERVRRWVVWNQARWPERDPLGAAIAHYPPLFSLDPEWVRVFSRKLAGDVPESTLREIEELMLSCCDRGYSEQVQPMISSWDVGPYLERIAVPTLVVCRRGLGAEVGADYAAHIAGAQLYLVEGTSGFMVGEEDPLPAILAFLTGDDERPHTAAAAAGAGSNGLSPRELEVVGLLASGCANATIAARLSVSEKTVARHMANIYTKLGVHNRVEAANWAREHRVV